MQGWPHSAEGLRGSSVPHPWLLSEVVLEACRATVVDVAFSVAIVASSLLSGADTAGVWARASGLHGSDETSVPGCRGLHLAGGVCC